MKRVLLTGATGLIGKYAIEPLIDKGFEVFAVSSNNHTNTDGVTWIKGNLLNSDEIIEIFKKIKPQYLLHFAWDTTPGSYLESELNYKWVNASLKMLEEFKNYGGKKAVFTGTCFEYEFKNVPIKETDKINPKSTYARCKNELREKAEQFSSQNGINFSWGRIFYVYGEGENEKRLVPHIIKNFSENKKVNIFTGELIKDYMFAEDIARAFVEILDSDVNGCINVCSSIPVKIKEIAAFIAKEMNKKDLLIFEAKDTAEPPIILGDNTRLTEEVKFKAQYSLEKGLKKMIDSASSFS